MPEPMLFVGGAWHGRRQVVTERARRTGVCEMPVLDGVAVVPMKGDRLRRAVQQYVLAEYGEGDGLGGVRLKVWVPAGAPRQLASVVREAMALALGAERVDTSLG